MTTRFNALAASAAATILLLVGAVQAAEASDKQAPTAAQISAAHTPAEHKAIAQAFDDEAVALEAKAQAHEAMATIYRSGGGGPKSDAAAMVSHCESLVTQYRAAASEARALAAAHRDLAAKAGN
jgi:hypothetical protein